MLSSCFEASGERLSRLRKVGHLVRVMTFIGRIMGLNAPTLHAQYFEEFLWLSKYVEEIKIVTDRVEGGGFDLPSNVEIIKLPSINIPKIYGASKILFYSLAPTLMKKYIDVLYVRTFSPPELSSVWCSRLLSGLSSVLVLPGTWLFGHPSKPRGKERFYRWFLRRALNAAEKIVLYSKLMLPEIKLYDQKVDDSKFVYIHNAVNVDRFSPNGEVSQRISDLKNGRKCIIYVGRLNEKKGLGDVVSAFRTLKKSFPDAVLALAGVGTDKFVASLRQYVEKFGLSDSVLFLGSVPNSEIPALLRGADLFVYGSREGEGIPRAILEAMACGKPVVATRVAGTPEAVADGVSGFLVNPRDLEGLASKMLTILCDDGLAVEMGRKARQKVVNEFSYEVVVPKIANLLKEVAGCG